MLNIFINTFESFKIIKPQGIWKKNVNIVLLSYNCFWKNVRYKDYCTKMAIGFNLIPFSDRKYAFKILIILIYTNSHNDRA